MGLASSGMSAVTFEIHEASAEVLVNNFKWILAYGYGGNQSYPIAVDRLTKLPEEVGSRALGRFGNCAQVEVKLPDYGSSFNKISSYKSDLYQKLLSCFTTEACSRESLSYYRDAVGKRIKNVRFWIAPVDPRFPVIMYLVEGVPYIGKVYFDTQSIKPVYSEFKYISDDPHWRKAELKLMDAIRSEGDLFELKNRQLTAGAH